jgi:PHD/YefM family antitoxin component YafN of YafNO toxin-antitoxin module
MMISLDNIHSFTQFQRNAKAFADQVRGTKKPIVLTVNGEAALVVHEARAFQAILDRMSELESEVTALKRAAQPSDVSENFEA